MASRERIEISGNYSIVKENQITFFEVEMEDQVKRWLTLYSDDFFILYEEGDLDPFFLGINDKPSKLEGLYILPEMFEASSYLVEGEIEYAESNLGNLHLDSPWVESGTGYGINQTIRVRFPGVNSLTISNGFVSFNKPYLYERNGRVKKIGITDMDNGGYYEFEIPDSPNPFHIYFDQFSSDIEIEVLEVYEGDRWEDTCINFIMVQGFIID
ncbi:MAG: hypothetical protein GVY20_08305 [Bacteroidetes bacterium]|nr:hypothetical protein [Bacteroidota bacterium]